MPGKAKRKGKHPQSKKSKAILRQGTSPGTAVDDTVPEPAAPAAAAVRTAPERPAGARPAARAKSAANLVASAERYPFYIAELKRIGVLAAVIIVVLVVLSVVLS
jgi:hypothetical protein